MCVYYRGRYEGAMMLYRLSFLFRELWESDPNKLIYFIHIIVECVLKWMLYLWMVYECIYISTKFSSTVVRSDWPMLRIKVNGGSLGNVLIPGIPRPLPRNRTGADLRNWFTRNVNECLSNRLTWTSCGSSSNIVTRKLYTTRHIRTHSTATFLAYQCRRRIQKYNAFDL